MEKKIRVLFFAEAAAGGVLSVMSDQIKVLSSLKEYQFEFTILYCDREHTPKNIVDFFPGCTVEKLPIQRESKYSFLRIFFGFIGFLKSNKFDYIHCHSSIAGFIGRISSTFLYGTHFGYTPHCYAFLASDRPLYARCAFWLAELLLSPLATTIACGKSELEIAKNMLGSSVVVTNGFDSLGEIAKQKNNDVISVGRICEQKGFDDFQFLAEMLAKQRFSYAWVGSGASAQTPSYVTGWLDRAGVLEKLASSKVYVSTARWEGLPVAPVEAMFFGLPVVALDAPGVRDVVDHGKTGFICETTNEMLIYVEKLLNDPCLYMEISKNAKNFALENFSLSNYEKLAAIYSGHI